ncbi:MULTISPECIES: GntR family transcriptional regulator [unclassified Streptomyces]|uniref:GntR family transcriptional regulator n=1 Tax=unclassified Streptomyces TaxID=2593676 RepID=UPI000DC78898|nr:MULTISPECIES: GntR family transcriptional regulator [unclassified Streptomyces]AWZ09428.1 GntR family transcriptional regulator [Streptomyces sp. ICC4]AWZ15318.1 GntR family transcriptional regulator [Streptomyces sp. ICC1]
MSGSGAVNRNTLRRQIADALRDEVLAGRLPPGMEFTVKQIAEQYEVSATPVREALVDLSGQGLLDSVQHRGFRVRVFSVEDFRGMIEARTLIVEGIFRRLVERGTAPGTGERLVSVRRRGEEARRAALSGSLEVLIGYDLRFWRELSGLVGNTYISEFLHRLRVQCWVFAVPYLKAQPDLRTGLWSGHNELIDAVTRADAEEVRRLVHAYNQHGLDWAAGLRPKAAGP